MIYQFYLTVNFALRYRIALLELTRVRTKCFNLNIIIAPQTSINSKIVTEYSILQVDILIVTFSKII